MSKDVLSCLQVLGSSVRLPLHPPACLISPLHLLLLPGLWEGFLLERAGTKEAAFAFRSTWCMDFISTAMKETGKTKYFWYHIASGVTQQRYRIADSELPGRHMVLTCLWGFRVFLEEFLRYTLSSWAPYWVPFLNRFLNKISVGTFVHACSWLVVVLHFQYMRQLKEEKVW